MIGIFDSGSGGLTVAKAIHDLAPRVDILYFGDTANAPYGNRETNELVYLTQQAFRLLRARGAECLVSACNSVSAAVVYPMLEFVNAQESDLVEMVGPATDDLVRHSVRSIAVLATTATCRSGIYAAACTKKGIACVEIAYPALAGAIESGVSLEEIQEIIRAGILEIPKNVSDVLLGCTHYPLVLDVFQHTTKDLGRTLQFHNPALAVASAALRRHGVNGKGQITILCSKRMPAFEQYAKEVLNVDPMQIELICP